MCSFAQRKDETRALPRSPFSRHSLPRRSYGSRGRTNRGGKKQTSVHDISISIKCLIGVYISSFDPTRSRYRSSARFLIQTPCKLVLPPRPFSAVYCRPADVRRLAKVTGLLRDEDREEGRKEDGEENQAKNTWNVEHEEIAFGNKERSRIGCNGFVSFRDTTDIALLTSYTCTRNSTDIFPRWFFLFS